MKNNVAKYRIKMNLSQSELAKLTNVTRGTISAIERGISIPRLDLAFRISMVLKGEITTIFNWLNHPICKRWELRSEL